MRLGLFQPHWRNMIYTILHTIHTALLLDSITFFIQDFSPSKSGYIFANHFFVDFQKQKGSEIYLSHCPKAFFYF